MYAVDSSGKPADDVRALVEAADRAGCEEHGGGRAYASRRGSKEVDGPDTADDAEGLPAEDARWRMEACCAWTAEGVRPLRRAKEEVRVGAAVAGGEPSGVDWEDAGSDLTIAGVTAAVAVTGELSTTSNCVLLTRSFFTASNCSNEDWRLERASGRSPPPDFAFSVDNGDGEGATLSNCESGVAALSWAVSIVARRGIGGGDG